jgi:hypothetical protein
VTGENDAIGSLLLGGTVAAVGLIAWRARRAATDLTTRDVTRTQSVTVADAASTAWVHPVPSLDGRVAVISNEFRARDSADGRARQHLGVDLMYRRRDARDLIAVFPAGTPGGTPLFFMPENVPALAAARGIVVSAGMTSVGNVVIVQHANGWATYYAHLATLAVQKGASVTAGQILGTIGASPQDAAHVRHLHFELWKGGTRSGAVDPDPYLVAWSRTSTSASLSNVLIAASGGARRNGTLSAYRRVGESGEPYPDWVRRLRGQSGVYVIREIDGPILYVGSSVGRLYNTLTRHLQRWRRWKGYWREHQFAEGADPGLTYKRNTVEVAIKLTTPGDAHEEEVRMIQRLQPRDNQLGQRAPEPEPELEDAPF